MSMDDIEVLAVERDTEIDKAVCDCLYRLLLTLTLERAEVIWRIELLGEPRDRVAVSLGTSVNTITVRLHRGRQALKKRLEEMCVACVKHGFFDCRCDEVAPSSCTRERQGAASGSNEKS